MTSGNEKPPSDYVAGARRLGPQIAAGGEYGDRERRLSPEVVEALAGAGFFRMLLSPTAGGDGAPLRDFLLVAEAVAGADGSAGWCLVQGALSASQVAHFLAPAVAHHIFAPPRAILANGTGPNGRAVAVPGGYRLTGAWPFASGCTHATWFKGAAPVFDAAGSPVRFPDGAPDHRTLLFPAGEATVEDIWQVAGLRGTGSNVIRVDDLFVPQERTACLTHDTPLESTTLAALPYAPVAAAGFCSVAMGIARGALDAFTTLAAAKTPRAAPGVLRESPVVQTQVARAEAQLRAARAFVLETVADAWDTSLRGAPLTAAQRALMRLAATSAIHQAAQVVDTIYYAAGATAIFAAQPFERRFRDIHAVTQQTQANPRHFEAVGRFFLGLDSSDFSR